MNSWGLQRKSCRNKKFKVTAQVDTRPSQAPITSGALPKVVRTVHCAAPSQETPLPPSGRCGPLTPTAPAFLRAVTTYADSRVRPHSLGSVGKVRINARSPHPTPCLASPYVPPWTKATLPPQSEFSIKFGFLRVTCAFTVSFFLPEQLQFKNQFFDEVSKEILTRAKVR